MTSIFIKDSETIQVLISDLNKVPSLATIIFSKLLVTTKKIFPMMAAADYRLGKFAGENDLYIMGFVSDLFFTDSTGKMYEKLPSTSFKGVLYSSV